MIVLAVAMRSARLSCRHTALPCPALVHSAQPFIVALYITQRWQRSPPPRSPFAPSDKANARSWKKRVAAHERLVEAQREALHAAQRRRERLRSNGDGEEDNNSNIDAFHTSWIAKLVPAALRRRLPGLFYTSSRIGEAHKATERLSKTRNSKKQEDDEEDDDILGVLRESARAEKEAEGATEVKHPHNFFTKHARSLRQFFGFGTSQYVPMNPLMVAKEAAIGDNDPGMRGIDRYLMASRSLQMKPAPTERRLQEEIRLTPSEELRMMDRYARRKWYGVLNRPIRNLTTRQIRFRRNAIAGIALVLLGIMLAVIIMLYNAEVQAVLLMSPEDQKDYIHMVMGMRYGDIARIGDARLAKEDPLEALPIAARYHVVVEACREHNWHTMDWSTELRKMHPRSALEERDWRHLVYWGIIYVGNAMQLGGGLFTERTRIVHEALDEARRRENEECFVPAGPSEKPDTNA